MSRTDPDVAVVGCGPVGLTLAVLLAQRGHSVTMLERWAHPYPLPRAVHIDHEVARVLQSAGIGAELTRITEPADVYEWRNGQGTTLLRLGRVGPGGSGWPLSLMFHQPALEAVLENRARDLGVEIRRGCPVTDFSQHQHVVAACLKEPDRSLEGCPLPGTVCLNPLEPGRPLLAGHRPRFMTRTGRPSPSSSTWTAR